METPDTGEGVSGACHARGENAARPPHWIAYIAVADLDASVQACNERGGSVVGPIRDMGGMRFCVIRDPFGAYLGRMQQA